MSATVERQDGMVTIIHGTKHTTCSWGNATILRQLRRELLEAGESAAANQLSGIIKNAEEVQAFANLK